MTFAKSPTTVPSCASVFLLDRAAGWTSISWSVLWSSVWIIYFVIVCIMIVFEFIKSKFTTSVHVWELCQTLRTLSAFNRNSSWVLVLLRSHIEGSKDLTVLSRVILTILKDSSCLFWVKNSTICVGSFVKLIIGIGPDCFVRNPFSSPMAEADCVALFGYGWCN